ncbi:hypothetical protein [Asticcacaulis sp. AND118]|uniref:hypothetical protein n=1 Tax=Asticcacaulis sp. AND118 TaxID=2840468 RepID=UPI001CFFF0F0|nr:hypothetical protein [Asticcacaulis sp. AND118]UDF02487.1 hypothetical protein LH365_08550 [Asticcacaulis sp. AND118]
MDTITGTWGGTYSYPSDWRMEPCDFTARLIQTGSSFFGSMTETVSDDVAFLTDQGAFVEGSRHGSSISFVKTYDGSGDWSHSVMYEGHLSDDGNEIAGIWTIIEDGHRASSGFVMTRRKRAALEEQMVEVVKSA